MAYTGSVSGNGGPPQGDFRARMLVIAQQLVRALMRLDWDPTTVRQLITDLDEVLTEHDDET